MSPEMSAEGSKHDEDKEERKRRKKEKKVKDKILAEENAADAEEKVEEIEESSVVVEKKKKGKMKMKMDEDAKTSEEKKKKRKRTEENADRADEHRSKKSKNTTGFPDPNKDSTLPPQSQKALSYAFTQFRHPSRWKFHKARQNWLIRNLWSTTSIPDPYFPLILEYSKNIKGLTKTNLIAKCKSVIEADSKSTEETTLKSALKPAGDATASIATDSQEPQPEAVKVNAKPSHALESGINRARLILDTLTDDLETA